MYRRNGRLPNAEIRYPRAATRGRARSAPRSRARAPWSPASPDVIHLHPVLVGVGREAVRVVVRVLQQQVEALVLGLQLQVDLRTVVDTQAARIELVVDRVRRDRVEETEALLR